MLEEWQISIYDIILLIFLLFILLFYGILICLYFISVEN